MTRVDLVVVAHGTRWWGVPGLDLRHVRRDGSQVRLQLGSCQLLADSIVTVAKAVAVRPWGAVVRRYWPEPCTGLAVIDGRPIVVLDPGQPPAELVAEGAAAHEHEI